MNGVVQNDQFGLARYSINWRPQVNWIALIEDLSRNQEHFVLNLKVKWFYKDKA